jgi:hypothetical protein
VDCDKRLEVALCYPDGTTETVRYKLHVFDPATDGSCRHTKLLSHLVDREEVDLLTKMTTRRHSDLARRLALITSR